MQKVESIPPTIAYGTAIGTGSVPIWVDSFTTYGEVALLGLSIVIALATAVVQIRKAFEKK